MERKKYRVVKDLFGAKIFELNIADGTEDKIFKSKNFIEMNDEELADKITELKMQGLDVEKFHQEFKWRKIRNIRDY